MTISCSPLQVDPPSFDTVYAHPAVEPKTVDFLLNERSILPGPIMQGWGYVARSDMSESPVQSRMHSGSTERTIWIG